MLIQCILNELSQNNFSNYMFGPVLYILHTSTLFEDRGHLNFPDKD